MKRQVTLSRQVIKYLSVGCVANGLAYALYLSMTLLGINPVWSMTAVYLAACSTSFAANKVWTFKSDTDLGVSLGKYVIVQLLGYVTNLVVLTALHYGLGVPHSLAQLIGIAFVAIELFTLTRNYVFV